MYLKMKVRPKVQLIHQHHCELMSTLQTWMRVFFVRTMILKQSCFLLALSKWVKKIITHSHFDYELSVKLSYFTRGELPSSCYMKFIRKTSKIKDNTNQPDFAMISLCVISEIQLKKDMYWSCELATEKETTIP